MHVLFLTSWYPSDKNDISGCFFREQAIALTEKCDKVGVINVETVSLKKIFNKNKYLTYENDNGVLTYRKRLFNYFPKSNFLAKKTWEIFGLKMYLNYINKNGVPNIIHVQSGLYAGILALNIYNKFGVPYIITEHKSIYFSNKISTQDRELTNIIAINAKKRFAVSNCFAEVMTNLTNLKWGVIHNSVQDNFLEYKLDSNSNFTFITVCFLTKNKKVDLIIKAFNSVFKNKKNIKLKIVGDGPERKNLMNLIKELKIEDQVILLGRLSRTDVISSISLSNVYILGSEFETFGVAAIEALALGKPVLSTKCGGPQDFINSENGILVSKNSVLEMACGLEKIYSEYYKYNAAQIRDKCKERFSSRKLSEKILDIYNLVVEEDSSK